MARLARPEVLNTIVSHLPGVVAAVAKEANEVGLRASANLDGVRASTVHVKLDQETAHQTKIEVEHGDVDSMVILEAPSAMSLEFGHEPSGAFAPGRSYRRVGTRSKTGRDARPVVQVMSQVGEFGREPSKAPEGQYILYRAAGLI